MNRALGLAAALTAVSFTGPAAASPEDLFGYGGRTSAMGATGAAHATGYEAAFHNPALASRIPRTKLTLGYGGAAFALEAPGPENDGSGRGTVSSPAAKGFVIGGDLPIPFGGRLRDRVGIALAFGTPSDVVVRGRVLYPERPQFPLLADRAHSVTIRAGLGADIGWGIRVGAGFAALAEILGTVVVATDVTGRVGSRVDDQLVATYAPVLGASYDLPLAPDAAIWRVGLAYRGTLDARFGVVVDGTKLSTLPIPLFNISGIAQYDPAQVALELARIEPPREGRDPAARRGNVLALQVVYKRWSDFPGLLEPTVVCSDGGAGACGLTPPVIAWRDTVAVRVGAEQGFALAPDVVLRARGGGFLETSALPSDVPGSSAFDLGSRSVAPVPTRYFDATRVALTAGAGASFRRLGVDLDLYGQLHTLLPRTIQTTAGTHEAAGQIKVFGLTLGVGF